MYFIEDDGDITAGSITTTLHTSQIDPFNDYLKQLTPNNKNTHQWFDEYWQDFFECDLPGKEKWISIVNWHTTNNRNTCISDLLNIKSTHCTLDLFICSYTHDTHVTLLMRFALPALMSVFVPKYIASLISLMRLAIFWLPLTSLPRFNYCYNKGQMFNSCKSHIGYFKYTVACRDGLRLPLTPADQVHVPYVIDAVYAVAHGLQNHINARCDYGELCDDAKWVLDANVFW